MDSTIAEQYPLSEIKKLQRGEPARLPSIREFVCTRVGNAAVRRESLRTAIERVYSPVKYPNLYFKLSRKIKGLSGISESELRDELLLNFYKGRTVNPDLLVRSLCSQERRMFAKIRALTMASRKNTLLLKLKNPGDIVENLTGIAKPDIFVYQHQMHDFSSIAEYLTRVIFRCAHLIDLKVSYLDGSRILRDTWPELEFSYTDRKGVMHNGRADLRNGNRLIEVKAKMPGYRQKTEAVAEVEAKCKVGGINFWESWDPIRRSLVVLHQDPAYSNDFAKSLRKDGILVMEYPKIRKYLEKIIPVVKERYGPLLESLRPGFHLEDLLQLEEELCLSPFRLLRGGMDARREWTLDLLKAIDVKVKEIQENGGVQLKTDCEQKGLESLCNGREIQYSGGHFLYARKSIEELGMEEVGKFIKLNRENLSSGAKKRFPELARIPTENILFFDIETGGFLYQAPIHTIALAHVNNGLYAECLIARNPSEEKAMLQYFSDHYSGYTRYFTYNGTSFDVPFIPDRMHQNGVLAGGDALKGFDAHLEARHDDLYPIFKGRMKTEIIDHKLATAEKVVLKHTRTGDVHGGDIPKIFRAFSYGESNAAQAMKVIEHNMKDAFTTAALLMYLRA
ncbi:MAG: ribonuclease H-like domain-containing protein [Nanoarchaeota archaeon]